MKTPHSLIPEQKENIKHGEVYFPIQKYITKLTKEAPVRIPFRTKSNTAAEALIRDFSYRSVYDLLHDEPHTFSRSRTEEDFLSEEQK